MTSDSSVATIICYKRNMIVSSCDSWITLLYQILRLCLTEIYMVIDVALPLLMRYIKPSLHTCSAQKTFHTSSLSTSINTFCQLIYLGCPRMLIQARWWWWCFVERLSCLFKNMIWNPLIYIHRLWQRISASTGTW